VCVCGGGPGGGGGCRQREGGVFWGGGEGAGGGQDTNELLLSLAQTHRSVRGVEEQQLWGAGGGGLIADYSYTRCMLFSENSSQQVYGAMSKEQSMTCVPCQSFVHRR
jgi:hypothetical protein